MIYKLWVLLKKKFNINGNNLSSLSVLESKIPVLFFSEGAGNVDEEWMDLEIK